MRQEPRVRLVSPTFLAGFGFGIFLGVALALLAVALVQEPEPGVADVTFRPPATNTPNPALGATATRGPQARTKAALDVRLGPGSAFAIIGVIAKDEALEIVGRDHNGEWLAVRFPPGSTARGWLPVSGVQDLTGLESFAVVLPTPLPRTISMVPPFSGLGLGGGANDGPLARTATPVPTPAGPPDLAVTSLSLLPDGRVSVVVGNRGPGRLEGLQVFVQVRDLTTRGELLISGLTTIGVGGTLSLQSSGFRVTQETDVQAIVDPFATTTDGDRSNNPLQVTLAPPLRPTRTPE